MHRRIQLTAVAVFMLCCFFAIASISAGDHLGWMVAIVGMVITAISALVGAVSHV